jgi:plastocyanin
MKKINTPMIFLIVAVMAAAVLILTHSLSNRYLNSHNKPSESAQINKCDRPGQKYSVNIENNRMNPKHTEAKTCDTLTITNSDNKRRELAFGRHNHHVGYDGISEKGLNSGESLTITLNQTGTFTFHDHFQEEVAGDFTVTN